MGMRTCIACNAPVFIGSIMIYDVCNAVSTMQYLQTSQYQKTYSYDYFSRAFIPQYSFCILNDIVTYVSVRHHCILKHHCMLKVLMRPMCNHIASFASIQIYTHKCYIVMHYVSHRLYNEHAIIYLIIYKTSTAGKTIIKHP